MVGVSGHLHIRFVTNPMSYCILCLNAAFSRGSEQNAALTVNWRIPLHRWIQGLPRKNIDFVCDKIVCYTSGSHVCFLDLDTKTQSVFESPGRGVGALTANGSSGIFAFSEQKLSPSVFVYIYPELQLKNKLKGKGFFFHPAQELFTMWNYTWMNDGKNKFILFFDFVMCVDIDDCIHPPKRFRSSTTGLHIPDSKWWWSLLGRLFLTSRPCNNCVVSGVKIHTSYFVFHAQQLCNNHCNMQELGKCWSTLFALSSWEGCDFTGIQPSELAPALCFGCIITDCMEYWKEWKHSHSHTKVSFTLIQLKLHCDASRNRMKCVNGIMWLCHSSM